MADTSILHREYHDQITADIRAGQVLYYASDGDLTSPIVFNLIVDPVLRISDDSLVLNAPYCRLYQSGAHYRVFSTEILKISASIWHSKEHSHRQWDGSSEGGRLIAYLAMPIPGASCTFAPFVLNSLAIAALKR